MTASSAALVRGLRARAIGVVVAILLGGCSAPPVTEVLVAELAKAPTDQLGLKVGKPYAGTRIRLVNCCNTVPQFAALKRRTAEFTARTGIAVEWSNIPWNTYLQRIVAESALGGGTYDVVVWPDAWGPSLKIGVQPLDAAMHEDGITLADFSGAFRQAATAGSADATYGIPFRGFSYNLFYRKDVYAKLGLQPPRTWEEYYRQLQLIKTATDLYPLAAQFTRQGGSNLFTWLTMLWSNGAEPLDPDGRPAFTTPAAIRATQEYVDSIRKGYSPAESSNWSELESNRAFQSGRAATILTWAWHLEDYENPKKSAPDVLGNVGVATLPGFAGRPAASYAYTWLAGVLNTSRHQGAAWEYVKWLTSADTDRRVVLDKSDPATSTGITVHDQNMRDPAVNAVNGGVPAIPVPNAAARARRPDEHRLAAHAGRPRRRHQRHGERRGRDDPTELGRRPDSSARQVKLTPHRRPEGTPWPTSPITTPRGDTRGPSCRPSTG